MLKRLFLISGLLSLCALSSCSYFSNALGFTVTPPDAYSIETVPAPVLPPAGKITAPVPQPGAPDPFRVSDTKAAAAALNPAFNRAPVLLSSPGIRYFLLQIGRAPVNIREEIAAYNRREEKGYFLPNGSYTEPLTPTLLNQQAEAARLRENALRGLPPTAGGNVPVLPKNSFLNKVRNLF